MAHRNQVSTGWRMRGGLLAAVGVSLAGASLTVAAPVGPSLGGARSFAVLGGEAVSNTGSDTIVTGDLGVSPGSAITGFGPGQVTGGTFVGGSAEADLAHADASLAYDFLAGMASIPANNLSDTDLGGLTLAPGVYKFDSSAGLTGALTLNAHGDSHALFVIQVASALTTGSGASVVVTHGGANYDESNVFWQVGSSATLGAGTAFIGNILAYADITLVTGSSAHGNLLAIHGAVTLDSNAVTSPALVAGGGDGRPSGGHVTLTPPDGAPDVDAFARLNVKHFPEHHARAERSWFRLKVRHLDAATEYTLWANDPSTPETDLVQFDSFTTAQSGNFNYTKDTKRGDTLPFGATLNALSGMAIEVRGSGTTPLAGTIPTTSP